MKERPILFSGPMVNAIRDGRKRQTRRKHKGRLDLDFKNTIAAVTIDCPYGQPSDKLWCRETWAPHADMPGQYIYRADRGGDYQDTVTPNFRWRPSIFMPRKASRILLEITAVRIERLQDISEEDAQREGLESVSHGSFGGWKNYLFKTANPKRSATLTDEHHRIVGYQSAVRSFQSLWESINGQGSWDANPWVWVIEFKVLEGLNQN